MDIPRRCAEIERKVEASGQSMAQFLRGLEMAGSTWHRWKTGESSPIISTWNKVEMAEKRIERKAKVR